MLHPFPVLEPEYTSLLAHMSITDMAHVDEAIREIMPRKADYLAVQAKDKVPAGLIGAIDYREDDCNPHDGLGQGDPWNQVSRNVPAGKGPFSSWIAAAVFYINYDKLNVLSVPEWTWPYVCWKGEAWNGFGPRSHGCHSGYLWGCTSIYTGGMYPRDHKWSSTAKDKRPGIIPIMRKLSELDADFAFGTPIVASSEPISLIPLPVPEGVNNALWVQMSLNRIGQAPPLLADGNYGRRTRAAVAAFQQMHLLTVDGLAGPQTIAALETALPS